MTSLDTSPKVKRTPDPQNGSLMVVPLPPPNSCLKTGAQTTHRASRVGSRVGLRVHFKLPEDEEEEQSDELLKGPPAVLAKPKL